MDASRTTSFVLNSELTQLNLIKFLHYVEKCLPINKLETKLHECHYQDLIKPTCIQNLTAVALAIHEIRTGHPNLKLVT